jgi:hypothetical protein
MPTCQSDVDDVWVVDQAQDHPFALGMVCREMQCRWMGDSLRQQKGLVHLWCVVELSAGAAQV